MKSFASDNNSGIHPDVLRAIAAANEGDAAAYGDDPWTKQAEALLAQEFGSDCEIHFVLTGSGANIISLALAAQPFHAVICAQSAHINLDECGAPERFTGCKLVDVETVDGKLRPADIEARLNRVGDQHAVQPKVVSITQSNELGLAYTIDEIKALADFSHARGLYLHVDGARLANAVVTLGCSLRASTRECGVDVLSLGGTKNGLMCGECVVVFNPELFGRARFIRKSATQLASKMRFVAAQFIALFTDDLWRRNAAQANRASRLLADKISGIAGVEIVRPVQANAIFACVHPELIAGMQKHFHFYVWDPATNEVRWMTSFNTTEEEVETFASCLREFAETRSKISG